MHPRPHLSFCACKTGSFRPDLQVAMGPRPHLSYCACKTARIAPESLVSMGPSPHLLVLDAKQRLLDQNNKSLLVQNMACQLCVYNSVLSIRITSLYGSQPSFVVFACETATYASELQLSMGPRPHLSLGTCKTGPESLVSMGPSPHLLFLDAKQRLLDQNNKSLWLPDLTRRFMHANHSD